MKDARAIQAEPAAPPDGVALAVAAPALPWPGEVPAAPAAQAEIGAALAAADGDVSPIAARVAREVSEIERSAFEGMSLAEPVLLRSAAALRLRLAVALATAPEQGELDDDAAQKLLADADEVLTALARESAEANELVSAALGAVRTELVRDAIRVSEAQQRLANPPPQPVASAPRPAAQVRVLSNESDAAEAVVEKRRRGIGLWVALGLAVLAAGGYHVNRAFETNRAKASMVRVDGAPDRVMATPEDKSGQLLFTPPGAPLTEAELKQLRAAQQSRGRMVTARGKGVYVVQKVKDAR